MHFQISLKLTNIVVIVVSYCGINEVFLNILCNSVICIEVFYNSCSSTFVRPTFISSKLIIRGESIDERIPTKTDWYPTLKRHRASLRFVQNSFTSFSFPCLSKAILSRNNASGRTSPLDIHRNVYSRLLTGSCEFPAASIANFADLRQCIRDSVARRFERVAQRLLPINYAAPAVLAKLSAFASFSPGSSKSLKVRSLNPFDALRKFSDSNNSV